MNFDYIEQKLNKLKLEIQNDDSIKKIAENIKNNKDTDIISKEEAKQEYYSQLSKYEKKYQQENDKYKEIISQFPEASEMPDFYVGPELPREHYLQSKKDIQELYAMFAFYAIAEPYINAYHDNFG